MGFSEHLGWGNENRCPFSGPELPDYLSSLAHFPVYTTKNATNLLQVVNFTVLLQLVNKSQTCLFHQVATSLLKSSLLQLAFADLLYNLLKQLATSHLIISLGNQRATSPLTTCNRPVVNILSQAKRMHSDSDLL